MSLYNKLQIWLSIIFVTLMISVFGLLLHSSHTHLKVQQKVEMTNMISSLNIALTPFIQQKDTVGIESVINASFDSGFYGSISFKMNDGNYEFVKNASNEPSDAPLWFKKLAPFKQLTESRILMDGWMQAGSLTVTNNTNLAYDQLWNLALKLLVAFIINSILAAASMTLLLKLILKPLKNIQKQANEISLNQFSDPIPQVNTRELSDVIRAMNYMSQSIESNYLQSADEVERLRKRAYQDPVSGLSNREYFISQLEPWLKTQNTHCGLWLMSINVIEEAYQNKEFEKAEAMVKQVSEKLSHIVEGKSSFSRFNRSEFALLVPHCHHEYLQEFSNNALDIVNHCLPNEAITTGSASIGMLILNDQTDLRTVFTQLDNALTQARQQSGPQVFLFNDDAILPEFTKGKIEWQNFVKQAVENRHVQVHLQPVINKDNDILHYEAFAYIDVDNITYTVNHFITALKDSDIASVFDRHVIDLVINLLRNKPSQSPITINITKDSIRNSQFVAYFTDVLKNNADLNQSLIFELPEICFIKHMDETKIVTQLLLQHSFQFGIDNFGHSFSSVDYLPQVKPTYVKLDFAYTTQLDDPSKYDILASFSRIAKNLGINMIASHVETLEQIEQLARLDINRFQGKVCEIVTP